MRFGLILVLLLAAALSSSSQQMSHWVGSWACSQQVPEPSNALPTEELRNATLRQVIHLSAGGSIIRVHLSNAFGVGPLHLLSVHVARPVSNASAAIDPATDHALTFAGQDDVIIPSGAEYVSDSLPYAVKAGADLAISIHYEDPPQQETGHPGSRATSYLAQGDQRRCRRSSRGQEDRSLVSAFGSRCGGWRWRLLHRDARRFHHGRTWRDHQWERPVAGRASPQTAGGRTFFGWDTQSGHWRQSSAH